MVMRQLVEFLSLRLPYVYFRRASHLLFPTSVHQREHKRSLRSDGVQPQAVPSSSKPADNLQLWRDFVNLLVDEWRAMNIISTLLLSYAHFLRSVMLHLTDPD